MVEEMKSDRREVEEAPSPKGKKSFMLWIVIGVVALGVLGGGGFFAWKTFLKTPETKGKAAETKQGLGELIGHAYPLEPFLINLAGNSGNRYLKVAMTLDLNAAEPSKEVAKRLPQIRDALLFLLTSKTLEDVQSSQGKVTLQAEATSRINAFLQSGQVKKIYFTEFIIQ